jgi:hypothetical protein
MTSVWLVLLASRFTVHTGVAATGRRFERAIPAIVRRDNVMNIRGLAFIRVPY